MELRIAPRALQSALQGAKETFPNEFLCLFVSNDGLTVEEIMLAPLSAYGPHSVSFNEYNLPALNGVVGTFHSHPSGILSPSSQDLRLFSAKGSVHAIAGPPFELNRMAFFDRNGARLPAALAPDGTCIIPYK